MHITRVEIENIKSFARAEFEFERGKIAIVGCNGVGKTTILEAIAWALFDSLDYKQEDFLRRGAARGWVRVTFQSHLDDRQYTVYRNTAQTYYVYDPALNIRLAEGRADVRNFLRPHLGIEPGTDTKALFRSAIGVPQGAFTAEFMLAPAQRKASFDRLLKVEEYRESSARLIETTRLIQERIADVDRQIANAEGRLANYETLTADLARIEAHLKELRAALGELEQKTKAAMARVARWEEAARLVGETHALWQKQAAIADGAGRRLAEAKQRLAETERAAERQRTTRDDYEAHLRALAELRRLEQERIARDRLRAEMDATEREVLHAQNRVQNLEEELRRAQEARARLQQIGPLVERQEDLERERDRLRELRAELKASAERANRLREALERLRAQHKQTRERIRQAEAARDAQQRVESLESERLGLENEIAALREALNERRLLEERAREMAQEVQQLEASLDDLRREAEQLEERATVAAELPVLEREESQLRDEVGRLRATIERDERMQREVAGGLCPILSARCLNLAEGETLESYFIQHLGANRARLKKLEKELARLTERVKQAQAGQIAVARLKEVRLRLEQDEARCASKREALRLARERLSALAHADKARLAERQAQMVGLDAEIKKWQREALKHAELDALRARLQEIEEEGSRLKEELKMAEAVAAGLPRLETDLLSVENELRVLGDPRGQMTLLRAEAERESDASLRLQRARVELDDAKRRAAELGERFRRYDALERNMEAVRAERDRTAAAHQEYVACGLLVEKLPECRAEVERAERDAAEAQRLLEKARAEHEQAVANYDADKHAEERTQLETLRERVAAIRAQQSWEQEHRIALQRELEQLDAVRARLEGERRKHGRLMKLKEGIEFIREKLREAGPLVAESYLYNVSVEANQLFREMMGRPDQSLRWSRDYEIILEEGGHERAFQNLSGGEQMVAALSVRLALLKELSDVRIAFFDEPTVNMDAERRERLAQIIGQVRDFDQLFVISHDDTFEQTVDAVVSVERP